MTKDRVINAYFMIKDRVIEVQKIPAIGIIVLYVKKLSPLGWLN